MDPHVATSHRLQQSLHRQQHSRGGPISARADGRLADNFNSQGLIWFWVPAALVIFNDIAAYVCGRSCYRLAPSSVAHHLPLTGMLFGRHQLIKLSPKKTVEGFVGAFFVTIVLAVGVSFVLARLRVPS